MQDTVSAGRAREANFLPGKYSRPKLFCFAYGFVKGMDAESKLTSNAMTRLIDKIPPLPEPDDIPFEEFIAEMAKDEGIQNSSF